MRRPVPVLASLIVLAAIATMVGLGIWQLQRAEWKEGLLARYASADQAPPVAFPAGAKEGEALLYRRSTVECGRVTGLDAAAGRNAQGIVGWGQVATCRLADGTVAEVVLGWSAEPNAVASWPGGEVSGVIAPGRDGAVRLVADPPQAGLAANATPDPAEIPNNHTGYAVQWFIFAFTAALIYLLALRKRWLAPARGRD